MATKYVHQSAKLLSFIEIQLFELCCIAAHRQIKRQTYRQNTTSYRLQQTCRSNEI